jgi:hypothetical protein
MAVSCHEHYILFRQAHYRLQFLLGMMAPSKNMALEMEQRSSRMIVHVAL